MGAGNQQGRPDPNLANYIAGFVDGEGSFHVAVQKNPDVRLKWQLVPEFQVSQNEHSAHVLELIRETLNCGYIKPNHRHNPHDETYIFVVRSRSDLATKIVPFFQEFQLRTEKKHDFHIFAEVVFRMCAGEHQSSNGLSNLLRLAFSMNRSGRFRRKSLDEILMNLEPSETVRQTLESKLDSISSEDTVRSARRRAETN
ncbi:hypothetical protein BH24PSE2_BH24PSE2_14640 [soil metagenome]